MKTQHQTFVKEKMGGKTNGEAYAKAYNRSNDDYTRKAGFRLMSNDDVSKTLEDIERELPEKAAEAYQEYIELGKDPKTPASIKEKILSKRMSYAPELRETHQIEQKTEIVYKGLNDDLSWLEPVKKVIKARKENK